MVKSLEQIDHIRSMINFTSRTKQYQTLKRVTICAPQFCSNHKIINLVVINRNDYNYFSELKEQKNKIALFSLTPRFSSYRRVFDKSKQATVAVCIFELAYLQKTILILHVIFDRKYDTIISSLVLKIYSIDTIFFRI